MAWFLFIDESGIDGKESPYEVLAGAAIHDRELWEIIQALHAAELASFGRRYSAGEAELKGCKILKTKVFHHAALSPTIAAHEIAPLAKEALDNGEGANVRHLKALALAKLGYVRSVFDICRDFGCKAFASIVEQNAPATVSGGLRKDYGYLFQRFYYFLEDMGGHESGIIVFDELEKAKSHLLVDQAHRYFKETATGRARASLIVPEPFFVHSDLTTGIQIADLIAYTISWGFRMAQTTKPARAELASFAAQVAALRYRSVRPMHDNPYFTIWSFAHITDLRTQSEKDLDE